MPQIKVSLNQNRTGPDDKWLVTIDGEDLYLRGIRVRRAVKLYTTMEVRNDLHPSRIITQRLTMDGDIVIDHDKRTAIVSKPRPIKHQPIGALGPCY